MIDFKDILDFCQAEAIASQLSPTEEAVWRSMCRMYSAKFHTPLAEVLKMDPQHVILNVYESQMEEVDLEKMENLEKIQDTIAGILDPNHERKKANKLEDDIAKYEREEEERVAAGRAVHPSLAKKKAPEKTVPENENPVPENRPTGGSIDLSYFEKEDSES